LAVVSGHFIPIEIYGPSFPIKFFAEYYPGPGIIRFPCSVEAQGSSFPNLAPLLSNPLYFSG